MVALAVATDAGAAAAGGAVLGSTRVAPAAALCATGSGDDCRRPTTA
ncbi:hypothetical protein PF005_g8578 [Phytophthora fragariae]|uniref:Uncharacterized protein n=1 Tax=Phytophthora fragariae TaxID=53985 RepID=A0A6A3U927_9STRA|nr:hypothetical protein PF003_g32389 [Phytophthora fragariae]KAE8940318.1 hypothetical protein PF009_g9863 [Phytophthora fragariae]KAE8982528.1 hypothetical protein PF011_g21577 [Phytophthora fragariae]KAE9114833.1 hypothetical protein PF010_g9566 [Phytophthora fragariae]KAE9117909.1 hypothetical protein PF007_g9114 [Phytophthora fragariae]